MPKSKKEILRKAYFETVLNSIALGSMVFGIQRFQSGDYIQGIGGIVISFTLELMKYTLRYLSRVF